jgi:hypothetical protein
MSGSWIPDRPTYARVGSAANSTSSSFHRVWGGQPSGNLIGAGRVKFALRGKAPRPPRPGRCESSRAWTWQGGMHGEDGIGASAVTPERPPGSAACGGRPQRPRRARGARVWNWDYGNAAIGSRISRSRLGGRSSIAASRATRRAALSRSLLDVRLCWSSPRKRRIVSWSSSSISVFLPRRKLRGGYLTAPPVGLVGEVGFGDCRGVPDDAGVVVSMAVPCLDVPN